MNAETLKKNLQSVTTPDDLIQIMSSICSDLDVPIRRGTTEDGDAGFYHPHPSHPHGMVTIPEADDEGWHAIADPWYEAYVYAHETLHAMDYYKMHPLRHLIPGNLTKSCSHFRAEVAVYFGVLWMGTHCSATWKAAGWRRGERHMPGYLSKHLTKMTHKNHWAAYNLYTSVKAMLLEERKELKAAAEAAEAEAEAAEAAAAAEAEAEAEAEAAEGSGAPQNATYIPDGMYVTIKSYAASEGCSAQAIYKRKTQPVFCVGKIKLIPASLPDAVSIKSGWYRSYRQYADHHGISTQAAYKRNLPTIEIGNILLIQA